MDDDPRADPLTGVFRTACTHCKREATIRLDLGMGLKVGDDVYRDPERSHVGRCTNCKRHTMKIIEAPYKTETPSNTGFWKVPKE